MKYGAMLILLLLGVSSGVAAETPKPSNQLLVCDTQADAWKAELALLDEGRATLKLSQGDKNYRCDFKLQDFSYLGGGEIPKADFVLTRQSCVPELLGKDADQNLPRIYLTLRKPSPKSPSEALLQWQKYHQLTHCKLSHVQWEEIRRDFEKWKKGLWGR